MNQGLIEMSSNGTIRHCGYFQLATVSRKSPVTWGTYSHDVRNHKESDFMGLLQVHLWKWCSQFASRSFSRTTSQHLWIFWVAQAVRSQVDTRLKSVLDMSGQSPIWTPQLGRLKIAETARSTPRTEKLKLQGASLRLRQVDTPCLSPSCTGSWQPVDQLSTKSPGMIQSVDLNKILHRDEQPKALDSLKMCKN